MRRSLVALVAIAMAFIGSHGVLVAQEATPSAAIVASPDLCTLQPISFEAAQAISATPAAPVEVASPEASPTSFEMPMGEPVDDATRQAIMESMTENFACVNTGNQLLNLAIYSEAARKTLIQSGGRLSREIYDLLATPQPIGEENWTYIVEFRDMVRLDDGRVAALIVGNDPTNDQAADPILFVLVEENGHWFIDEVESLEG